jgi:hypothetical protein
MAIYKGCGLDHLTYQFKSYGSPELVFPESTVEEAPLRNLGEGVRGGWTPTSKQS